MTLRFITALKAQIDAQMPDNSTGLITPAIMRANLQDMVDSLYGREVGLFGDFTAAPLGLTLQIAPAVFPTLTPLGFNQNPTLFTINTATGKITALAPTEGFIFFITVAATWSAGANVDVLGQLYKNNIAIVRFILSEQGTGAGELKSVSTGLTFVPVLANDVFDVRWSSPGGPVAVTFQTFEVVINLLPTNVPVP